jgi:HAD superfamily hydrolase (TIGR01509 family)
VPVGAQPSTTRLGIQSADPDVLADPRVLNLMLTRARAGAVIFDCDGTLIDSEMLHATALRSVLETQGVHIPLEILQQRFTGVDNPTVFKTLDEENGFRFSADCEAQIQSATHELITRLAKPMPWGVEVVTALTELGFLLAVASNSTHRNVELMLKHAEMSNLFGKRIATGDQVEAPKPAPDVYVLAAKLSHAAPGDCVAIDDSPAGLAAARAAGMIAIGYNPPGSVFTSTDLLTAGASLVIRDLRVLPAAAGDH